MGPPENLDFLKKPENQDWRSSDEDDEGEEKDEKEDVKEVPEQKVEQKLEAMTVAGTNEDESDPKDEEEVDDRPPQEIMDELLLKAFLQALKTSASAKKVELPMLTSNFFRVHMVKQCPKGKTLDVKKSSHKKLSKFLQAMEKDNLVVIKELTKGVESITAVNYEDPRITTFRVVKVAPDSDEETQEEVLPCDREYEPPKITELLTVSGNVLPLFKCVGLKKGDGLTPPEVRSKIKEYVQANNLQQPNNKVEVNLDPVLASVVLVKGENSVVTMRWDDLNSRVQAKMSDGYALEFPGSSGPSVHKGKLEPITLTTATRSGNKKVTLIHNLEPFRINPTELARKCQVGVAASTSVHEAPNKKNGSVEVLVQGNQTVFVSKLLLTEYKVPRKYIKGIEEAKKKKGGGGGGKK